MPVIEEIPESVPAQVTYERKLGIVAADYRAALQRAIKHCKPDEDLALKVENDPLVGAALDALMALVEAGPNG